MVPSSSTIFRSALSRRDLWPISSDHFQYPSRSWQDTQCPESSGKPLSGTPCLLRVWSILIAHEQTHLRKTTRYSVWSQHFCENSPSLVTVEAISGKRSAADGEPEGQKGRRKHIKQQPAGSKDDVTMESTSAEQKGTAKGANKSTDAKLHNAVLKTLCVLSQKV